MQDIARSPRGTPPGSRSARRYGTAAIVLHWLLVLGTMVMAVLGWFMVDIEKQPGSARYFDLHKSLGLVIALLVVTRVAWRMGNRVEGLSATLPMWQVKLAHLIQLMLYALMVLVPLTGYLGASYSKAGVIFFGLPTPRWFPVDEAIAEQVFDIHSALVWIFVALVAIHVLGALKHLLVDKDGVFERMWF
jgi:cytochrome b561